MNMQQKPKPDLTKDGLTRGEAKREDLLKGHQVTTVFHRADATRAKTLGARIEKVGGNPFDAIRAALEIS